MSSPLDIFRRRWSGLTLQLFLLILLPLTLLLLLVSVGGSVLHQRAMRDLVGERDRGVDEDLVVQGTVKGRIGLRQNIVVEESGVLEANVESATITIHGTVTGDIQASERAELKSNCRVVGDIRSPRVLIADGASFKGSVDMDG